MNEASLPTKTWFPIVIALLRPLKTVTTIRRRIHRRAAEARLIADTSLFDRDWYLRTYPDVAAAGVDALIHYLENGWEEGRDPGPEFATTAYLQANPDVARSGVNPLVHYIEFGHAEGRGMFGHRPALGILKPEQFQFESAAECFSF